MDSMVIKGLDPDTSYQFAVRAVNPHGLSPRSQPSDTIRTAREYCGPSEGQTEVAALLGLPPEDPLDGGCLAPRKRAVWKGVSSAFPAVVFPGLWKLEALHRARLLLCTGGQQKAYFCIILREFEVSFLSWVQNRSHTKVMCSPCPFPSFGQNGFSLASQEKKCCSQTLQGYSSPANQGHSSKISPSEGW